MKRYATNFMQIAVILLIAALFLKIGQSDLALYSFALGAFFWFLWAIYVDAK